MKNEGQEAFLKKINGFMPGISLDCVVFGYRERGLKVLLLKFKGVDAWALPGGFLPMDREMDATASEVLYERTGVRDIFLRQFHTFDALDRCWDCNPLSKRVFESLLGLWPDSHKERLKAFFNQRFLSTAYMALVHANRVQPVADYASEQCAWVDLNEIPSLVLDHRLIVDTALKHLREQINYLPIGRSLLPDRFTMSEMQSLYEAILGRTLDRGNFQRKILKLGFLHRHGKLMTGARNKAPYLYSIDQTAYEQMLGDGLGFH